MLITERATEYLETVSRNGLTLQYCVSEKLDSYFNYGGVRVEKWQLDQSIERYFFSQIPAVPQNEVKAVRIEIYNRLRTTPLNRPLR